MGRTELEAGHAVRYKYHHFRDIDMFCARRGWSTRKSTWRRQKRQKESLLHTTLPGERPQITVAP
jgi:hypothetical protein